MSNLLPCPFCGEAEGLYPGYRSVERLENGMIRPAGKPYQIDCIGCGIEFQPRDGMDVIEAWNRRARSQP